MRTDRGCRPPHADDVDCLKRTRLAGR
jgi:hypothetical protein